MKIEKILSKRYGNIYNPKTYQATQIVYEWEDILAATLEAPVIAQFNRENTLLIEMSPQRKRGKLNLFSALFATFSKNRSYSYMRG